MAVWIKLAVDIIQRRDLVNTLIDFQVTEKEANFFIECG
jgi:hypothetical protein